MAGAPIIGLVLAAGAGRRLGTPKAEVVVAGRRLIDRAVSTLRDGGCDEVVAVLRSSLVQAPGARCMVNPDADSGMGSSLRCGLAALDSVAGACVVLLVDLPGVRSSEVAAVISAYRAGAEVVAIRRAGRRSHPVLVARRWFTDFAEAAVGDAGGRAFFAAHAQDTVFIEVSEPISDIDTPDDLSRAEIDLGGVGVTEGQVAKDSD